jgi:hypothetical protein
MYAQVSRPGADTATVLHLNSCDNLMSLAWRQPNAPDAAG